MGRVGDSTTPETGQAGRASAAAAPTRPPAAKPRAGPTGRPHRRAADPTPHAEDGKNAPQDVTAGLGILPVLPGAATSLAIHVALLVVLALLTVTLRVEEPPPALLASTVPQSEYEIEQFEPPELELETLDDELPSSAAAANARVVLEHVGAEPDVGTISSGALGGGLADLGRLGLTGDLEGYGGEGRGSPGAGGASFFGIVSQGNRFVYVVDNSKSMKNGRFEKACTELIRSIDQLTSRQKFYVIFFSDKDYPLFYPRPARNLLPATSANRYRLKAWMTTVKLVLKTNAKGAMQRALALRPDAVYLLTDGRFTDNTERVLGEMKDNPIPIHTIGFESKQGEPALKKIARQHHGTYRFVE